MPLSKRIFVSYRRAEPSEWLSITESEIDNAPVLGVISYEARRAVRLFFAPLILAGRYLEDALTQLDDVASPSDISRRMFDTLSQAHARVYAPMIGAQSPLLIDFGTGTTDLLSLSSTNRLDEAVEAFTVAAKTFADAGDVREAAKTQLSLGSVLLVLAQQQHGTEPAASHLAKAVSALRSAQGGLNQEEDRHELAQAQRLLGTALTMLAQNVHTPRDS